MPVTFTVDGGLQLSKAEQISLSLPSYEFNGPAFTFSLSVSFNVAFKGSQQLLFLRSNPLGISIFMTQNGNAYFLAQSNIDTFDGLIGTLALGQNYLIEGSITFANGQSSVSLNGIEQISGVLLGADELVGIATTETAVGNISDTVFSDAVFNSLNINNERFYDASATGSNDSAIIDTISGNNATIVIGQVVSPEPPEPPEPPEQPAGAITPLAISPISAPIIITSRPAGSIGKPHE